MTITSSGPAPEDTTIEPGAVLRRRPSPDVEWVLVEGEVVAWNADSESLHLLDRIASVVFQLLDGVTPLKVTIQELAEAFSRDVAEVEADVLTFAVSLQEIGIVERVR